MKLGCTAAILLAQAMSFGMLEAQTRPVRGQVQPRAKENWVVTWATAQLLVHPTPASAAAPTATQAAAQTNGQTAAAARPAPVGARGFHNQTVRQIARVSIGGTRIRIKLENAFNGPAVEIGAVHIALRDRGAAIVDGSDRPVLFDGKPGVTLGPGVTVVSDAVSLHVAPLADVAVSLYLPGDTGVPTIHSTALHTTFIKDGDTTSDPGMSAAETTQAYYWLAAIDVDAPSGAGAIVTFGDSITDGARSSNESNHSWPALLAARLADNRSTTGIGVANEGIGGNRVLRDGSGASSLARLDRDVLSLAGVKWLMVLEGINDIGHAATTPEEHVTADDLIAAHKQIIQQAHTHGIKVIGCTLTPYEGAGYARDTGEEVRAALNRWIRSGGAYDAVVDFEAAVRDKDHRTRFKAEFDPGDHLHPNDAGYQAMADAIDLSLFGAKIGAEAKGKEKRVKH